MNKKLEIIVSGSIAIDRIMTFGGKFQDNLNPEALDKVSISVLLDSLQDCRGGVAGNICYSLALLGDNPVLLGSVGQDGANYTDDLESLGVNTASLHISSLPTASFTVITDGVQNQIGGFYPGAMSDSSSLKFENWQNKDCLAVISPHDPSGMKRQVAECKTLGLHYCYDVGQQISNLPAEDLLEGIAGAYILILNEYELSLLCQKTDLTQEYIWANTPIVVTTLGENGCRIQGKNVPATIVVQAAKPTAVVDPTGAGDAFRAGFLYGFARGWNLKICAQLGATTAVYAVETVGTQNHTFSFEEVASRYKENFKENL